MPTAKLNVTSLVLDNPTTEIRGMFLLMYYFVVEQPLHPPAAGVLHLYSLR